MGWAVGYDEDWQRDIGYGVPSTCDHPDCKKQIDRGLAYVCGGEPYGGERGCGLYFCGDHMLGNTKHSQLCERCVKRRKPFSPKPDVKPWLRHKLRDPSWKDWRDQNPRQVEEIKLALKTRPTSGDTHGN